MNIWQAFVLGLVQGLTEFLPISSSGHLVLFQAFFGLEEGVMTFDIAVHFATLIAVFFVFWKDVWEIIKKPFGKLPLLIVAGTIPTVIIMVLFEETFEKLFQSGVTLGFEFIFTGLILWYAESIKQKKEGKNANSMTFGDAALIGAAQGLAILPAVSRSGLTLAGALFRGLNREFALKFSFLMSIPAILGPAVIEGYELTKETNMSVEILPLLVGMTTAGISGYFAIRFMLKVFTKASLKVFSYYVFVLGALVLVDQVFFGRFFTRLF